jgi:hypothetical protein
MRASITTHQLHRLSLCAVLAAAGAGCGADERVGVSAAAERRPVSEQLAKYTGLSHLPVEEDRAAFNASIRRHYPAEMLRAGRGGDVLVDVRMDESGRVLDVDVVEERRTTVGSADEHRIVVVDKAPGSNTEVQREVRLNYDPDTFGPAAEAALREVRFRPALRDGKPVPYTLRMTVRFDPANAR